MCIFKKKSARSALNDLGLKGSEKVDNLTLGHQNIADKKLLVQTLCSYKIGGSVSSYFFGSDRIFSKWPCRAFKTRSLRGWDLSRFEAEGVRPLLIKHVSEVPKRGRSKRGRTQKHANEHKRAQTQVCKRAQKGAKECKRALPRKHCKQPGLKQPGL